MKDDGSPVDDPRSLASGRDRWLTDTRVYNLIWLGRWLERAENLCRALDSVALASAGKSDDSFWTALTRMSSAWGIPSEGQKSLEDFIWLSPSSSVLTCVCKARENASQVAPLELIQSINSVIQKLGQKKAEGLSGAESLHEFVTDVLDGLKGAFGIIEATWFRREALGEDEILRRFVQQ